MTATRNPWTRLTATTVYENPWIRVEDHAVRTPAGTPGQYGKVCFKNLAVAVVAIDTDDRILLVGQHRYTLDAYSWELPMGGAPLGSDPRAAAERELREETGYTARDWRELMRLHTSNSVTDEAAVIYVAAVLEPGPPAPEDTEELELAAVPFADAVERVERGDITDALSAAAILRVALERAREGAAR